MICFSHRKCVCFERYIDIGRDRDSQADTRRERETNRKKYMSALMAETLIVHIPWQKRRLQRLHLLER